MPQPAIISASWDVSTPSLAGVWLWTPQIKLGYVLCDYKWHEEKDIFVIMTLHAEHRAALCGRERRRGGHRVLTLTWRQNHGGRQWTHPMDLAIFHRSEQSAMAFVKDIGWRNTVRRCSKRTWHHPTGSHSTFARRHVGKLVNHLSDHHKPRICF